MKSIAFADNIVKMSFFINYQLALIIIFYYDMVTENVTL